MTVQWTKKNMRYEQENLIGTISDLVRDKYHTTVQFEYTSTENPQKLTGICIEKIGPIRVDTGTKMDGCGGGTPHAYLYPTTDEAEVFAENLQENVGNYEGLTLEVKRG